MSAPPLAARVAHRRRSRSRWCSRDLAEIAPTSVTSGPPRSPPTTRAAPAAPSASPFGSSAQRSAIGISAAHNSLALRIAARQLAAADHPARPSLVSLCREPDRSTPSAHGALAPAALVTLRRLLPNHWLDAASLDADARVWMRRAAREQAAAVDSGKDPTAGLRLASGADAAGLRALQCELLEGYCSRVEVAVRVAAMRTTAATVGLSLAAAAQRSAGRERPQLLAPFVQCEPSGGGGGGGPPAAGAPEAPAAEGDVSGVPLWEDPASPSKAAPAGGGAGSAASMVDDKGSLRSVFLLADPTHALGQLQASDLAPAAVANALEAQAHASAAVSQLLALLRLHARLALPIDTGEPPPRPLLWPQLPPPPAALGIDAADAKERRRQEEAVSAALQELDSEMGRALPCRAGDAVTDAAKAAAAARTGKTGDAPDAGARAAAVAAAAAARPPPLKLLGARIEAGCTSCKLPSSSPTAASPNVRPRRPPSRRPWPPALGSVDVRGAAG